MFTGIIECTGELRERETARGGDVRLVIGCPGIAPERRRLGDSVAVDGACLTVATVLADGFAADVSNETLAKTTLGRVPVGGRVNLEPALRVGDTLGGHMVSGHVDGVGALATREEDARSVRMVFTAPPALARYLAPKGSICVNGVSLTVNEVDGARFGVNLVPHTMSVTNLGALACSDAVNLEVDMVARYLDRLLEARAAE